MKIIILSLIAMLVFYATAQSDSQESIAKRSKFIPSNVKIN